MATVGFKGLNDR